MKRRDFIKGAGALAVLAGTGLWSVSDTVEAESGLSIKAIKLYEKGFMPQPFVFGGEEGQEAFELSVRYRSSLQSYLIDTGREVILVDTSLPESVPQQVVDEKTTFYMGDKIADFVPALKQAGYAPEQVSKILITHKHLDHTGALHNFPKAKIFIGAADAGADELKELGNVVPVGYTDGAYYNFPACQKIADGIYMVQAVGHTKGNSIIMVESGGLFYMLAGDATYTDEALYQNKISVVYEDLPEFRKTMDRIRQFVGEHPTVYCSSHTPLGHENLEAKRVVDLGNMPAPLPLEYAGSKTAAKNAGKYVCSVCGYVYDPAKGDPKHGIPAGTRFEDLPADWHCPRCKQGKDKFNRTAE